MALEAIGGVQPQLSMVGGQSHALSLWTSQSKSGIRSTPRIEDDQIMIRFVTGGRWIRRNRDNEYSACQGEAVLVALQDMISAEASPNFSEIGGTISRSALLAAQRNLDGDMIGASLELKPVVAIDSIAMHTLLLTFNSLHKRIIIGEHHNDLLFPLFEEIIGYQLLSCWPRRDKPDMLIPTPGSTSHVRRAVDYIENHLAKPIKLSDIAASIGVSVRTLQLSFKREMDATPVEFIIERRLQRVHHDLCTGAGPTAASIAQRWGFIHMSDFTQRYHRRFGCTPGKTLRR